MKKLMMFAAAMTIVGGAFADCGDTVVVTNNCSLVYDVKISAKTTVGKFLAGSVISGSCGDASTNEAVCYRVIGSVSLKGFYTACDCDCATSFMQPDVTLWNPKAKVYVSVTSWDWDVLNVIGKKNTEVEGAFKLTLSDAELYGAGFGKWDSKNARVTSISGNIVGTGAAPECETGNCDAAIAYPCGEAEYSSKFDTVASGTWSLKYNKSLSKKLADEGDTALPYPNY